MGEVSNTGQKPAQKVVLAVSFPENKGGEAVKESCELFLLPRRSGGMETTRNSLLQPGEKREFRCNIESLPADWNGKYSVEISEVVFEK